MGYIRMNFTATGNLFNRLSLFITLLFLSGTSIRAGVGESAVITLIFPPGARATGMGEAFTGAAEDASATYYNPAGLGLAPQANSWKIHMPEKNSVFTAISSKKKKEFGPKDKIWVGTQKGVYRFNGKSWESGEIYLIEENDNISSIIDKYLKVDDEKLQKEAAWVLKSENGIGMKRHATVKDLLMKHFIKSNNQKADSLSKALARQICEIPSFERSVSTIKKTLGGVIDTLEADTLSELLDNVFVTDDTDLKDLQELKIPFRIAVNDSVTAILVDESERVWVGTEKGLWRYSGTTWQIFTTNEGLPSNNIKTLAAGRYGDIAAGTDKGLAVFRSGNWKTYDTSSGLPSNEITAVAFGEGKILYAGTNSGLVKINDESVTVFDSSNGLLSTQVTALFMDSEKRLWIGGKMGVTIYDESSWKQHKFPESKVTSFTEQSSGMVWIGTDKGVISYKRGHKTVDNKGNTVEKKPEWKFFHSKNALSGDYVNGLSVNGNDVWIATDKAVNQYDIAEKQAYLSFEPLLPALHLRELWHLYGAFIWPTEDWGTLGFSINYINMGENQITDALGRERGKVRSWEGVFGLSYGLPIKEDLSLGLNIKYIVSALAPGYGDNGEGVGQTFAIDASVLKRNFLLNNLDLGFIVQNMGPHIYYIDRDNPDPIPFTLRLGLVYHAVQTQVHDLKILLDLHKEVVKNNADKPDYFWEAIGTDLLFDKEEDFKYELQEINFNLGLEYWYTNFLALRSGFLGDYIGERYELTLGVGLRYGTLNFDWSYIVAPEGFMKKILQAFNDKKEGATGVRHGQWRASFLVNF